MRFLHTSDWHLGAMDGNRSLLEDQKYFIDTICEILEEEKVDAVLLAGDVYDRSVSSAEAISLYDYAMTRICAELGVKVLTIAGNHDSAERLSSCADLLEKAGLHVVGALEKEAKKVSFQDTEVYFLPWITEEKVRSLYPEKKEEIKSLTDAYALVTGEMRKTFTEGKKHLILSHAFITNAETSTSDRAAEIGHATQVSASVFEGFDYVALGHIHKPQNVNDCIRYSGTPMPYSFGKEESQEKSVTLLDTETMEKTILPLPLLNRRTTIQGTLEEVLNFDGEEDVKEGYVRLQITDSFVGLETLSELRKIFPKLLEVSGKTYEGENTTVTLTMDEFEQLESDPVEIFKYFCREEMKEEADERMIRLFMDVIGEEEA